MPARKTTPTPAPPLDPARVRALRRALLAWYRKHHRKLPWRPAPLPPRSKPADPRVNPYHTLVSEAMLQQTQVATVVPYFERFIAELPTVRALADADEQRVLRLWQGLGYYRRARNLHAAAKHIVNECNAHVPADVPSLLRLPGVGRYTAGAIASIAHNTPAPIVDGNVARVFARVFHLDQPIDRPDTQQHLWSLAEQLVPQRAPGDFNQALMELGAVVCTPKSPGCPSCPLRNQCDARTAGDAPRLPRKLPKKQPRPATHLIIAAQRRGRYLFEQRPPTGLWPSMWQLPTWEDPPRDVTQHLDPGNSTHRAANHATRRAPASGAAKNTANTTTNPAADCTANNDTPVPTTAHQAIDAWFAERFNLTLDQPAIAHAFTHQTTHRTIRFFLLTARAAPGRTRPHTARWLTPHQLDDLPLPNPQRHAIHHLT